jgi:hypothetical protein
MSKNKITMVVPMAEEGLEYSNLKLRHQRCCLLGAAMIAGGCGSATGSGIGSDTIVTIIEEKPGFSEETRFLIGSLLK